MTILFYSLRENKQTKKLTWLKNENCNIIAMQYGTWGGGSWSWDLRIKRHYGQNQTPWGKSYGIRMYLPQTPSPPYVPSSRRWQRSVFSTPRVPPLPKTIARPSFLNFGIKGTPRLGGSTPLRWGWKSLGYPRVIGETCTRGSERSMVE